MEFSPLRLEIPRGQSTNIRVHPEDRDLFHEFRLAQGLESHQFFQVLLYTWEKEQARRKRRQKKAGVAA